MNFLSVVAAILNDHEVPEETLQSELRIWFMLLLELIDITGNNSDKHFEIFTSDNLPIISKHRALSQMCVSNSCNVQCTSFFLETNTCTLYRHAGL